MPRALMLGVAVPGEGSEGGFVLKRCRAAFEAEKLPPVQGQAALPRIRQSWRHTEGNRGRIPARRLRDMRRKRCRWNALTGKAKICIMKKTFVPSKHRKPKLPAPFCKPPHKPVCPRHTTFPMERPYAFLFACGGMHQLRHEKGMLK